MAKPQLSLGDYEKKILIELDERLSSTQADMLNAEWPWVRQLITWCWDTDRAVEVPIEILSETAKGV